jgi:hypothetical protein
MKKFLSEYLKGRDHSEDLVVDGKIILEWMSGKQGRRVWTVLIWPNFVTRRRRPLKRPLDGYNLKAETGNLLG